MSIVNKHPDKMSPLGISLVANDGITTSGVAHRSLAENGHNDVLLKYMEDALQKHHISPDALQRHMDLITSLKIKGLPILRSPYPQDFTTQKGNFAEVFLAEYLSSTTDAQLPIYRLRYNTNPDQSMKGDDVLLFDLDADPVRIIVGESKFRTTPDKHAVVDIVDGLVRSNKAGLPISQTLILLVAVDSNLISFWLIIRLLRIILSTYFKASLWSVLPPLSSSQYTTKNYIQLLSGFVPPVTELWPSQVAAIPLAVGENDGGIINLRTSGGKTRVAEIAIINTLSSNSMSKVLYLAPFRSLAFEVEQSLSKVFNPLGITVSQLYGGSTANLTDFELINESQVVIATPEKAKALIRCGSGLETKIKLGLYFERHDDIWNLRSNNPKITVR